MRERKHSLVRHGRASRIFFSALVSGQEVQSILVTYVVAVKLTSLGAINKFCNYKFLRPKSVRISS